MPFISSDSKAATGSAVPESCRVSISGRLSPFSPPTVISSSRATRETKEICWYSPRRSLTPMPICLAISGSVGTRESSFSSLAIAFSISRALYRTDRGTQSIARSSSMIDPRMRLMA